MKFLILALCVAAVAADPHWLVLPANEVAAVKSTWNSIKHDEVAILEAVFKAYPDIQARFPKFAGKSLDSIKGSADFAIHASRIVSFFSEYIAFLGVENTQPAIKTILNELGQSHRNRGVTKAQFEEFHQALNAYLKSHANWNPDIAHAWDDAFDKAYFVIFSALDGKPVN
uniref:Globin n=1 Tax=Polypedilum vanderplanki TaxID=319348 RepID=S6B7U5_POLVA|nr:globin [Polypedilum vanderplanki]